LSSRNRGARALLQTRRIDFENRPRFAAAARNLRRADRSIRFTREHSWTGLLPMTPVETDAIGAPPLNDLGAAHIPVPPKKGGIRNADRTHDRKNESAQARRHGRSLGHAAASRADERAVLRRAPRPLARRRVALSREQAARACA